jgi:integrase/recombinase XerD
MTEELNKIPNGKETVVIKQPVLPALKKGYRVSQATRPVSFINEEEVYRLADAAGTMRNGERNYLMVLVLFQAALRVSEAVGLKVRDLTVVDGKHVLLVLGKGGKPRLAAIPEKLFYHLGDYARRYHIGLEDRFFPITRVRTWQIIKQCAEKAGIDRRIYCHLLRHGGAIARLRRTGNPKSLQIHLGHSDLKMTMRYLSTMQVLDSLETESGVEFSR